MTAAH
jgi:hypothetical protein